MRVELHSHSIYSKGTKIFIEGLDRPQDMVIHAKKIGLGAIAITDHNTIQGSLAAVKFAKRKGIVVIPGCEISSKDGHILGLGIEECISRGLGIEETLDKIHEQGGIGIASHPFDLKSVGLGKKSVLCDAVEVFNGVNLERISNWKAKRFAEKNKLRITAGSDAHSKEMLGFAATKIAADNSIDSILNAIKKGRVSISDCEYVPTNIVADWAITRLKYSYGYTMNYIENNYRFPKKHIARRLMPLVKRSPGRIDYLFRGVGYFGVGCAIVYRAIREVLCL